VTPPDPRVKAFIDFFCTAYAEALGRPYVVNGAKDGATVKRLLRSLSLDELQRAAGAMFCDEWGKERASVGLLASQINSWRGGKAKTAGKTSGFTPAKTGGTDYASLARRFEK